MPDDEARSIAERFAKIPRLPSSLCPLLPVASRDEKRTETRSASLVLAIFFFLSCRSSLPLPRGKSMEMGRRSNIDRRSSSHSTYVLHSVGVSANCVRHWLVSAPTLSSTTRLPPPLRHSSSPQRDLSTDLSWSTRLLAVSASAMDRASCERDRSRGNLAAPKSN